jgi:hypothetical protein
VISDTLIDRICNTEERNRGNGMELGRDRLPVEIENEIDVTDRRNNKCACTVLMVVIKRIGTIQRKVQTEYSIIRKERGSKRKTKEINRKETHSARLW